MSTRRVTKAEVQEKAQAVLDEVRRLANLDRIPFTLIRMFDNFDMARARYNAQTGEGK